MNGMGDQAIGPFSDQLEKIQTELKSQSNDTTPGPKHGKVGGDELALLLPYENLYLAGENGTQGNNINENLIQELFLAANSVSNGVPLRLVAASTQEFEERGRESESQLALLFIQSSEEGFAIGKEAEGLFKKSAQHWRDNHSLSVEFKDVAVLRRKNLITGGWEWRVIPFWFMDGRYVSLAHWDLKEGETLAQQFDPSAPPPFPLPPVVLKTKEEKKEAAGGLIPGLFWFLVNKGFSPEKAKTHISPAIETGVSGILQTAVLLLSLFHPFGVDPLLTYGVLSLMIQGSFILLHTLWKGTPSSENILVTPDYRSIFSLAFLQPFIPAAFLVFSAGSVSFLLAAPLITVFTTITVIKIHQRFNQAGSITVQADLIEKQIRRADFKGRREQALLELVDSLPVPLGIEDFMGINETGSPVVNQSELFSQKITTLIGMGLTADEAVGLLQLLANKLGEAPPQMKPSGVAIRSHSAFYRERALNRAEIIYEFIEPEGAEEAIERSIARGGLNKQKQVKLAFIVDDSKAGELQALYANNPFIRIVSRQNAETLEALEFLAVNRGFTTETELKQSRTHLLFSRGMSPSEISLFLDGKILDRARYRCSQLINDTLNPILLEFQQNKLGRLTDLIRIVLTQA